MHMEILANIPPFLSSYSLDRVVYCTIVYHHPNSNLNPAYSDIDNCIDICVYINVKIDV